MASKSEKPIEQAEVNIGLIGCGYAGTKHVKYLNQGSTNVRLTALCDIEAESREESRQLADDIGVLGDEPDFYERASDIDYDSLDGVIIATPHKYHCEQILVALDNDTNVLVEKPISVTVEEAERIRDAVNRTDAFLRVSYQKRYKSRYYTAKKLIEEGAIGEIESISAMRVKHTESPYRDEWRAVENLSGGGQLFDIGNHMIDMVLWLSDRTPKNNEGVLSSREGANMEVYANIIGELGDGVPYDVSIHAYGSPSIEQFYISGSDASLQITKDGVKLYEDSREGRWVEPRESENHGPTDLFVAQISGEETASTDLNRWIESVKLTQNIYDKCDIK